MSVMEASALALFNYKYSNTSVTRQSGSCQFQVLTLSPPNTQTHKITILTFNASKCDERAYSIMKFARFREEALLELFRCFHESLQKTPKASHMPDASSFTSDSSPGATWRVLIWTADRAWWYEWLLSVGDAYCNFGAKSMAVLISAVSGWLHGGLLRVWSVKWTRLVNLFSRI